jgi:organic hydroperoxide reductase OsmC/OhrA
MKEHIYQATILWTGNKGTGTLDYASYSRNFTLKIANKPDLMCSADTPFRGDGTKHNPEDFFLASLSSCHMLWYFHLCADAGIQVIEYTDEPIGKMIQDPAGGRFTSVQLRPKVVISDTSKIELANSLHHEANKQCFIANSCNFPVTHQPTCIASNE